MSTGDWVLIAAVVLAVAFGVFRLVTDGRFRGTHHIAGADPDGVERPDPAPVSPVVRHLPDVVWGERATLVQFSTAFCAPCVATRRILAQVAAATPGVVHVEIDAESHLELVRAVKVTRTPTTIIVGPDGHELTRAAGAPRADQVLAVLSGVATPRSS